MDEIKEPNEQKELFPELEDMAENSADSGEPTSTEDDEAKKISIEDMIANFPGAPTREQIDEWKGIYGESNIFASLYSEDELYIYRPLSRLEWKNMMSDVNKATPDKRNYLIEEMTVSRGLLFPSFSVDFKKASHAGTITSLYTQILMVSNFISDAVLEQLIVKL